MNRHLNRLKNRKSLIALVALLGIVLITVGATYAWFTYSKAGIKENTITSGSIKFHYAEGSRSITLADAMPMADEQGKNQSQYFDFEITADTAKNMNIPYVVTARVDSDSTLPAEYVKIYVTDQSNHIIEPIKFFDNGSIANKNGLLQYSEIPVNKYMEKVVYEGNVPMNQKNYSKDFRIRIWISDDINMNANNDGVSSYNGATFKITFNVYAQGASTTEEAENRMANANIDSIVLDTINATTNNGTHYELNATITEPIESKVISINTVNPNATALIEKVNSLGMVIKDKGIKKISSTSSITLTPGINYFRITVKPENKSDPTIYYLTVNTALAYHITYNLNGGTQASNAVTHFTEQTATFDLPKPTKDGKVFAGWYENNDFSGSKITQIMQGTNGDKTFYARWVDPISLSTYLRNLSSDGVIQNDLSGDSNMRFIGNNPNNYINFKLSDGSTELWRIIGVFNSNSHGYDGDLVKIVRANSLGGMPWDTGNSNNWATASLNTLLNSTSYKYATSDYAQNVTWKYGSSPWDGNTYGSGGIYNAYNNERNSTTKIWTGTVALPYISDFVMATSGNASKNRNGCLSESITYGNQYWLTSYNSASRSICTQNSWLIVRAMDDNRNTWSLSPKSDSSSHVLSGWIVNSNGFLGYSDAFQPNGVLPTLYLKANIGCLNCNDNNVGTADNPYEIG